MSERYVCGMGFTSEEKPIRIIHDKVEDKDYYLFADICKIMNEQQATITALKEENEQLRRRNRFLEEFDGRTETFANLKEENEQLRNLVDWADSHFENDDDTDAIFKWNDYAEKLGANLEEIVNKGFDSDE